MGSLRYGAAIRDITPRRSAMLHGYAARTERSHGIAEPLRLGALSIADQQTCIVVVTVDAVGIHSKEADELAAAVEAATGVPAAHVLITASHTHFAPHMSTSMFTSPTIGFYRPEEPDRRRITDATVAAAKEAVDTMQEGTAESIRIPVPGVAFNRRTVLPDGSVETNFRYPTEGEYTFGPVDDELTAVRFSSSAGTGALLVNFGCHPVTGGYDRQADSCRVSSEYVYYLRRTLEEAWGMPAFFTLGAAGDTVPRDRYGESRRRIGTILAESVVLADRMFVPLGDTITAKRFEVPVETILSFDPVEAESRYESELAESLTRGEATEGFADALLARFRSDLYPANRFDVPINLFSIGGMTLVALPFEVLSEFALKMKSRRPESVLLSCAGGYQGYLPFDYEYDRGGYEASERSTHFPRGTADDLYERVMLQLDSM